MKIYTTIKEGLIQECDDEHGGGGSGIPPYSSAYVESITAW